MRINGFIYLVVGTFIAVISKIIDSRKLVLFVYAGIAFAIIGIIKIIVDNLRKQKPVAPAPSPQHPYPNGNHYVTRHHRVTKNHRVFLHYCRYCGNQLRPYDNFCSQCGQRI